MSESSWPQQPYEDQQPGSSELYPPQPADPYAQHGRYPHPYEPTHPAGWTGGSTGPPSPPKKPKTGLIIGLAFGGTALVVVLIIVGISVLGGGSGPAPGPAPEPTGSAEQPQQLKPRDFRVDSASSYPKIDDRADDSEDLTLGEIFGLDVQYPTGTQHELVLTKKSLDEEHCQNSVWGDQLKGALSAAECKQHVRGAYVDKTGKAAAQIGIFNVKTNQLADKVADALDPEEGDGFPLPLPDAERPWESFLKGIDEARVEVRGHYVTYVWAAQAEAKEDELIPLGVAAGRFKNFVYPRNK